jgi:hypothetical protein
MSDFMWTEEHHYKEGEFSNWQTTLVKHFK